MPGNQRAFVRRNIEGDRTHFLTLSRWDSVEAIKQFAGLDNELARYYPEDGKHLLEI